MQYIECAIEILKAAQPGDWFGFGGWCILGRFTSLLPEFWSTVYHTLPLIAHAGIRHVHIFGVLYREALGGLVWLTDQHGLSVSTDSTAPVLACTRKNHAKAGVRAPSGYWRDNVEWWRDALATLRRSPYYRCPRVRVPMRQSTFWNMA